MTIKKFKDGPKVIICCSIFTPNGNKQVEIGQAIPNVQNKKNNSDIRCNSER